MTTGGELFLMSIGTQKQEGKMIFKASVLLRRKNITKLRNIHFLLRFCSKKRKKKEKSARFSEVAYLTSMKTHNCFAVSKTYLLLQEGQNYTIDIIPIVRQPQTTIGFRNSSKQVDGGVR